MTIDERLEKLAERHEALTQTVEIITGMQKENEARVHDLSDAVTKLHAATDRLAYIAELHERRLDRAEVTIEAILEDLRRRRQ